MRKWWIILALSYPVMAPLTFAGANANLQYMCHHEWPNICTARQVRQDQFLAAFMASIPPAWVALFFVTAGYQDGLSFSATPSARFAQ